MRTARRLLDRLVAGLTAACAALVALVMVCVGVVAAGEALENRREQRAETNRFRRHCKAIYDDPTPVPYRRTLPELHVAPKRLRWRGAWDVAAPSGLRQPGPLDQVVRRRAGVERRLTWRCGPAYL